MKIPAFRPPNQTDFPAMPAGVEEPFKVTGKHMIDLTTALQGQLTVADNFDAEELEIEIEHNTPKLVALQKKGGRARGVSCIFVSGNQIGVAKLDNVAEQKVTVRVWLMSEDQGTYTARIIVWKGGI